MTNKQFQVSGQILKSNESLGLIFGFAVICKVSGEDFYDSDNEHITEQAMLEASTEFAQSARVACTMHKRDENDQPVQDGAVIHLFPLTSDIAKALDIESKYTGLLVAIAPQNPETVAKVQRGEYTGFSIGGEILDSEYEEDSTDVQV